MLGRMEQSFVSCGVVTDLESEQPKHEPQFEIAALVTLVMAALLLLSSRWVASAYAGDVTYAYDPQGRIVAAVDNTVQSGKNGVSYVYDLGGNLTKESLAFANTTALFAISPAQSPVGATVVIYGDGFSSTPAQNTVTINGVQATVTASTISTLSTSVPSGAGGTGVVQVTSPNGLATSTFNFTVTQN
jgi:hypothetical protein